MNGISENLKNEYIVEENDSAYSVGSGGLEVLSTPKVTALVENASYELLQTMLNDDETSVGIFIEIDHIAPTPIGMKIEINTKIKNPGTSGRTVAFEFVVSDEKEIIAHGIHKRVIVNKEKFMEKVNKKS